MDVATLPTNFLPFAHSLADCAGDIIRPYFGAHGEVEEKGDKSPVTLADKLAEKEMRKRIEAAYPDHAIYGEEFGQQLAAKVSHSPLAGESKSSLKDFGGGALSDALNLHAPSPNPLPQGERASQAAPSAPTTHYPLPTTAYTWVLDPIDGTRAFIAGRREWGTLIALCENGVPILGILDQPITGERWVGVRGQPTLYYRHSNESWNPPAFSKMDSNFGWNDGTAVKTRPCASLADAELSTTSAMHFTPVQAACIVKLAQACRATVKDGDCYAYGLLARGLRDVVVDAGLKPYDILALVPIIEGAGGKITGWDGEAVTLTNFKDVVAVGDTALWNQLVHFSLLI